MAGDAVVQITADNWKSEVLDSPIPVIVDFWAPWCGPCRMIAPVLDQLSVELVGKLKIVKVNVDENQALATDFKVRAIPTMLVFSKGTVQEQMTGALSKAALLDKLKAYL